ncbi:uncharacterized protein LOC121730695 [Aricia agestis]|uniref:uncharacterized protein LOC121730695 n=1 Tax=Aricia agestis TaxID=91739 RepID=UPI001C2057F8|nr:uncharacterized protein LOC121730695 [Aricia agestis]
MDESTKQDFEMQDYCECNCEDLLEDDNEHIKTLNKVSQIESYLKEKRILELIHFMLSKVVAEAPEKPVLYLEKLLDDCISFVLNRSKAPTFYENRHIEAVLKSFDPGQRGWLNVCQVRRLYESLGLEINQVDEKDKFAADAILEDIKNKQELALRELLMAGGNKAIIDKI